MTVHVTYVLVGLVVEILFAGCSLVVADNSKYNVGAKIATTFTALNIVAVVLYVLYTQNLFKVVW